eukprot:7389748-Prymnesium_polylepis.1
MERASIIAAPFATTLLDLKNVHTDPDVDFDLCVSSNTPDPGDFSIGVCVKGTDTGSPYPSHIRVLSFVREGRRCVTTFWQTLPKNRLRLSAATTLIYEIRPSHRFIPRQTFAERMPTDADGLITSQPQTLAG